jgi:hypothetical protein
MDDLDSGTVLAYPTQREAARMLGISESTLSRSKLDGIRAGARAVHYRPTVILTEAAKHKRRSLNEVAADLLRYARDNAAGSVDHVQGEIEDFFATRQRPPVDGDRFLAEAERTLPRRLYEQVKRAYDYNVDGRPIQLVGDTIHAGHAGSADET